MQSGLLQGSSIAAWVIAGALCTALVLGAAGVVPVRDDVVDDHVEASLTADYMQFESLYTALLDQQQLDTAYGQLAQPPDDRARRGADGLPSAEVQKQAAETSQILQTATSLGTTVRLAPARGLYVQALEDIAASWKTEQQAEQEWRAGRFPPDPSGVEQGAATHSLIWYRSQSQTSLGDAIALTWQAHQMVLVLALRYHLTVPESHIPMAPMPAFRGVG